MTDWFYKATPKKAELAETRKLALYDHFVPRSAYNDDGTHAALVTEVALGDTIHLYYRSGVLHAIGSFTVVRPEDIEGGPTRFGEPIEGTALFTVIDEAWEQTICGDEKPYHRDKVLDALVGWVVTWKKGMRPPEKPKGMGGMQTLVRAT